MAESSRCYKYGQLNQTVPRHECSLEWCEFDAVGELRAEIKLWEGLGLDEFVRAAESKLRFALEIHPNA